MKVKYNAALHRLERPDGRPVATFELDIPAPLAFKIADRISQADSNPHDTTLATNVSVPTQITNSIIESL